MERRLRFRVNNAAAITAVAYNPVRKEVVTGHEDGSTRNWEGDSGKMLGIHHSHKGWVTDLLYWPGGKVLFSSSVDGSVVQWSSSGAPYHTIELSGAVYSLLWSHRKDQLLCGRDGYISVLGVVGRHTTNAQPLIGGKELKVLGHSDVVKCMATMGSKVYSGGYDRKLILYEASSMPGEIEEPLKCLCINHSAHEAGITSILVAKDSDSSTWLATGSFDKRTKVWTADGKLVYSILCGDTVTGLCYVPHTQVLWVSAGMTMANVYEPKSGDNISEFVPILDTTENHSIDRSGNLNLLKYIPELHEVIATTNRKEVQSWRYNSSCAVCVQASPSSAHIETLTYTCDFPILVFSGSADGHMTKWERFQLNPFMYRLEGVAYREQLQHHQSIIDSQKLLLSVGRRSGGRRSGGGEGGEGGRKMAADLMADDARGFVKSLFVESLAYLVASSMDGKIFVWGYDMKTVEVLKEMQRSSNEATTSSSQQDDSVINRVAGLTCLHVLDNHSACVAGLAVVNGNKAAGINSTYLISVGWDLCISIWDLEDGSLVAELQNAVRTDTVVQAEMKSEERETIITDLVYCKERNVFAYSCSDNFVYIRKFGTCPADLKLVGTLCGHVREVTQVCWCEVASKWITASEDCTICTWGAEEGGKCEGIVSTGEPVTVLSVDQTHGLILAGVDSSIKVYNLQLELLQVNRGHTDVVRAVLHIPELDQYVSSSWDRELRVWSAYHPKKSSHFQPGETSNSP